MLLKIKRKEKSLNEIPIREFYNKRNKVVIIRNSRGIGDILNCRMLFKDFKKIMPNLHLTFACFEDYFGLVKGHPCVDEVIHADKVVKSEYMASYDISNCCIHYESREMSKNKKHRAEIWAEHCGISLENHDMDLPFINKEKIADGCTALKSIRQNNKLSVFFSPIAFEKLRCLTDEQIIGTIKVLREKGLFVYSAHNTKLDQLEKQGVPVLIGKTLEDWMSYIHAADYVVTADTSNFHYAGGIGKPMTGIFTHVDGKLRGKFYDFILVQKHRDDGNWPCGGPCYNYLYCSHPNCTEPVVGPNNQRSPNGMRPCLTEITVDEIKIGIEKMLQRWPI